MHLPTPNRVSHSSIPAPMEETCDIATGVSKDSGYHHVVLQLSTSKPSACWEEMERWFWLVRQHSRVRDRWDWPSSLSAENPNL